MRFAIVRSRFNDPITQALLDGAKRGFADEKVEPDLIEVYEVPGAFELPLAALWAAQSKRYNAVVCLGCVIRGETPHFNYVASEAARGIADAALRTGIPVIFGVLTTDTLQQAQARADVSGLGSAAHANDDERSNKFDRSSNKGYEAARSAVAMVMLRRKFD